MMKCPKCKAISGDDWSQCQGVCPMDGSPHFSQDAADGIWTDVSSIPDTDCGKAFKKQMVGRGYGQSALESAWGWFQAGWDDA